MTITADVPGRIVEVAVSREPARQDGRPSLPDRPRALSRSRSPGRGGGRVGAAVRSSSCARPTSRRSPRSRRRTDDVDFTQKAFDRQQDLLKKGVASQATYDQAENDAAHRRNRTLYPGNRASAPSRRVAALGGDPAIKTDLHPMVLAAIAKRDQAALDLAHTETRAPLDGVVVADRPASGRRLRIQPRRPCRRRSSAWSRPTTAGSRRTSRRPTSPRWCRARRRPSGSMPIPATPTRARWRASAPGPAPVLRPPRAERDRQLGQGRAAGAGPRPLREPTDRPAAPHGAERLGRGRHRERSPPPLPPRRRSPPRNEHAGRARARTRSSIAASSPCR